MYDPGSGNCKAKKGMLVLRECGEPATASCSMCGIPVCQKHVVPTEQGVACPECAAMKTKIPQGPQGVVGRARRRRSYYGHYGYSPYYYGYHGYGGRHYWSDDDYDSMDEREDVSEDLAEDMEADGDDADLDDFDDMES